MNLKIQCKSSNQLSKNFMFLKPNFQHKPPGKNNTKQIPSSTTICKAGCLWYLKIARVWLVVLERANGVGSVAAYYIADAWWRLLLAYSTVAGAAKAPRFGHNSCCRWCCSCSTQLYRQCKTVRCFSMLQRLMPISCCFCRCHCCQ